MNILIVDDHPLVRRGIIDILNMNKTHEDLRESDSIDSAMKELKTHHIDLMIVDLNLGIDNGFDLIQRAKLSYDTLKCVVLTSSSSIIDFKRAKELSVDGYIIKDAFIEDITYALYVINRGEKYYSPRLLEGSISGFDPKELVDLTSREKEVFIQLSKGLTNVQISEALYISEGTTKKHISNIFSKLNLNNRVEATLFARKLYGCI